MTQIKTTVNSTKRIPKERKSNLTSQAVSNYRAKDLSYVAAKLVAFALVGLLVFTISSTHRAKATPVECRSVERPLKKLGRLNGTITFKKLLKEFKNSNREFQREKKCGYLIAGYLLQNWKYLPRIDKERERIIYTNVILDTLKKSQDNLYPANPDYPKFLEAKIRAGVRFSSDPRFSVFKRKIESNLIDYGETTGAGARQNLIQSIYKPVEDFIANPLGQPDLCKANRPFMAPVRRLEQKLNDTCKDVRSLRKDYCPLSKIKDFDFGKIKDCQDNLKQFTYTYPLTNTGPIIRDISSKIATRKAKLADIYRARKEAEQQHLANLKRQRQQQQDQLLADIEKPNAPLKVRDEKCQKLQDLILGTKFSSPTICSQIYAALNVEYILGEQFHNATDAMWKDPDFGYFQIERLFRQRPWTTIIAKLNNCHKKRLDRPFPAGESKDGTITISDLNDYRAPVTGRIKNCTDWLAEIIIKTDRDWILPTVIPLNTNLADTAENVKIDLSDIKTGHLRDDFKTAAPNLARAITAESNILLLAFNYRLEQYKKYRNAKCNNTQHPEQFLIGWGLGRNNTPLNYITKRKNDFKILLTPKAAQRLEKQLVKFRHRDYCAGESLVAATTLPPANQNGDVEQQGPAPGNPATPSQANAAGPSCNQNNEKIKTLCETTLKFFSKLDNPSLVHPDNIPFIASQIKRSMENVGHPYNIHFSDQLANQLDVQRRSTRSQLPQNRSRAQTQQNGRRRSQQRRPINRQRDRQPPDFNKFGNGRSLYNNTQ